MMPAYEVLKQLLGTPEEGGTIQVIVDTTAKQLASVSGVRAATIKADDANSDTVWIGFDSSVDNTTGFPLNAGDHIDVLIKDLSKIYVVSGTAGQKLYVIWVR